MSNLTIENLKGVVQTGDLQEFFGRKPSLPGTKGEEKTFFDLLKESVDEVNKNQIQADRAIKETIAGRNKNIHETLLTIERADTSLKLMMQVRNKVLDAYKEIMRMQV